MAMLGVVLALSVCWIAWRLGMLTLDGALGAAVVGSVAFGMGGDAVVVALILFFVTSSCLSIARAHGKNLMQSARRNGRQVLSNGGAVTLFCVLFGFTKQTAAIGAAIAAIASANADTWATEIGQMVRVRVRRISNLRTTTAGASGGVSVLGTVAGFAGSILIASAALIDSRITVRNSALIFAMGCVGFLFDSLLGDLFQAHFEKNGATSDAPAAESAPSYGFGFLTNDSVNFVSTSAAAILAYLAFAA